MKSTTTLKKEMRMYRKQNAIQRDGSKRPWPGRLILTAIILLCTHAALPAQEAMRAQPTWWFGGAIGGNMNFYRGTTQVLNTTLTTPSAFHDGGGLGLYIGALAEYRPDSTWGGILQLGYDDRRGSFNDVNCPCGQSSSLSTSVSYFSIEPSLRFAPFSDGFYIFGGPQLSFNWGVNIPSSATSSQKTFVFSEVGASSTKAEFSDMKGTVFTGQIGVGYDFALTAPNQAHQVELSPFLSFHLPESPRSVESWSVATLRIGAALKFGSGDVISGVEPVAVHEANNREVQFSVRAPKAVPVKRRVRETFPLSNYVFFEEGSTEIPNRYVKLTKVEAGSFKEGQLQEVRPISTVGRSGRQMTVYYNILNIVGDRMRNSPSATIFLSGASAKGPQDGKARAEAIKRYLVEVFGIDSSRITTEGRDKPRIPSEEPGATRELALLRAGDSRVDIESESPEMMIQVGGPSHSMLKPVQIVAEVEDPLDSHVLFMVDGAQEAFSSWSLEITDDHGKVQSYGPFTRDQEDISGNIILGDRNEGDYKIVMLGETKDGKSVRRESSVHLVRRTEPLKEAVRYSILFNFDKSKTIASYEKFLTDVVAPLIPDSGIVIIHGYTDIIGEEEYNNNLSRERVQDARGILERAIAARGTRGITFETFGYGPDIKYAPFDNAFPEERIYNRTVIIDIVPE
ncbi:MAG TPA: outer membrane beta-barrel protein [Bacteroidota bacterium]|nr:outer membrane beta-barrel protein [Bacteroidota bacterium]